MADWEHCEVLNSGNRLSILYFREDAPYTESVNLDSFPDEATGIRETLTRLGRDGWEAFANRLTESGDILWFFKRPKT